MALLQPVQGPRELHERRKLEVFSPATLEKTGEIEVASASDVRRAVERARAAQPGWSELGIRRRSRYLIAVREALLDRADELVEIICSDTGKPRIEALSSEVRACCDALTHLAKNARRLLADRKTRRRRSVASYRPLGVVGVISPWNLPLLLALRPCAEALVAGNTVVLKPSEVTPFVGRAIGEVFAAAELPAGVFRVVIGDASTGMALVAGGCDKISFTGSDNTGREVAAACAAALHPYTLELGAKDPMIVCDDSDLDRAAGYAVWGAFANAGQVRTSIERAYVLEAVAQPFVDRVVALTRQLRQGPESEGEIDLGALVFPGQLEVIERHVQEALAAGARALTGGRRNPHYAGYFYEPTVLVETDHSMAIMREQTFGPTLPIQAVKDDGEAVRLANDSNYRVHASVWTRDPYRAGQLAKRIAASSVTVNDVTPDRVPESAFDFAHPSGSGASLASDCRIQSVVMPRFRSRRHSLAYPYSVEALRAAERELRWRYRSTLGSLIGR